MLLGIKLCLYLIVQFLIVRKTKIIEKKAKTQEAERPKSNFVIKLFFLKLNYLVINCFDLLMI